MGSSSSSPKSLHMVFGLDQDTRRGPTLGSMLMRAPQGEGHRLVMVAPLSLQLYDACASKSVEVGSRRVVTAVQNHIPFTTLAMSKDAPEDVGLSAPPCLATGTQRGSVVVFSLQEGMVCGPEHELRTVTNSDPDSTAVSITALHIAFRQDLFVGSRGHCQLWDMKSGELRWEYCLPGGDDTTPTSLYVLHSSETGAPRLWVGLDDGQIAVYDVQHGILVRSFACTGKEAVINLASIQVDNLMFAVCGHRCLSAWDTETYAMIKKYHASMFTCGSDLSAMLATQAASPKLSLLILGGVDGSLCVRSIKRRTDGKVHCMLLYHLASVSATPGCPITSIDYHHTMDSLLVGDASCIITVVSDLQKKLGDALRAMRPSIRPQSEDTSPIRETGAHGDQPDPSREKQFAETLPHRVEDSKHSECDGDCLDRTDSSSQFPLFTG